MTVYTIYVDVDTEQPSIGCGLCGAVSTNPHDIDHRYCGRCHLFLDLVAELRRDRRRYYARLRRMAHRARPLRPL